jgi:hypothetical protein
MAVLRGLAAGLEPGLDGVRRLLERLAHHDEAEALRAVLVEEGAQALLGTRARGRVLEESDAARP